MRKVLFAATALALALAVAVPVRAEEEGKAEKPKARQFTGEITKIEGSSVSVKKKDEEKTFTASDKVKVVVPGKEAGELSDLKVGDKVTVHFVEEDGKDVAKRIVHADAKPKKEKKTDE
jgi:Cu/Ag efflux protein CusF